MQGTEDEDSLVNDYPPFRQISKSAGTVTTTNHK